MFSSALWADTETGPALLYNVGHRFEPVDGNLRHWETAPEQTAPDGTSMCSVLCRDGKTAPADQHL